MVWNNEKIQEWRQGLGYASPHLVNKNLDNSNQNYSGVRHKQEVMPNKSAMVIFHSLSDPMRGIHSNKKKISVGLLENTHAGKKRWGIVFYSVKSKLLDYYILGSKDPTTSSTLYDLGNFISENSTPRMIISDSDGVLGSEKKWKHYLGRIFTPL